MISKIKKRALETLKDKRLYVFLAITLIFFGSFIIKQYATDSYLYFNVSSKELLVHIAQLGRLVTAVFWAIFSFTNFNVTYIASFLIAIIATTLSMYELNNILKRDIKNEKITMLISVLAIINIFSLELYMFLEKGIMMLSVLLNILAVGNIEKALNGDKKAWITILIEMFLANCCYQGTVGIFVAIGTIYIIKNSKTIWQFIKNNIIVAVLYAIPAICNLLIIKFIFNGSRLENSISLAEKVVSVFAGIKNALINSFEIIPPYVFLGFIILIGIIFIVKLFLEKDKNISKILVNIFYGLYIIVAIIFASSAPQILQAFVYMVPRNMYPFGAMIAVLLILMYQKVKINKVLNNCIILAGIIFLSIQYYNFADITYGHYYTNMKDREFAEKISTIIKDYEEQSNQTINKIILYKPEGLSSTYKNVRHNGDANVRAFYQTWGVRGIMNRFLQRQIDVTEADEEQKYREFFDSQQWTGFDEKQLIFEDDTLHLYII